MKKTWFFFRGLIREAGHWHGFPERFEKAFPGVRAVALDIPGNGKRFREKSPLSIPAMAEVLREEYLQQRGEENHLFALSLGAMLGLEWMHRWPEDFRSAVLVNTSLRGLSPFVRRLRAENYPRILRMFLAGRPASIERHILEMTSERRDLYDGLERDWVKIHEERPVSKANAIRQLLAAARFHPPLSRPKPRVLILNSGQDRLVHPSCSEALARHWSLPLATNPKTGHDLTLDDPDWVIEQVRKFSAE